MAILAPVVWIGGGAAARYVGAAGGAAVDAIRGNGPSGKPKVHNPRYPGKKAALEGAKHGGSGKPINHPKPSDGRDPHYHSNNGKGQPKNDGVHHRYPKRRG